MADRIRLDKWLWQARFFKSRTLATAFVAGGHLRLNGQPMAKAAHPVQAGDALTFVAQGRVQVVHILACGTRRGPAAEAQALYQADDPATVPPNAPPAE